MENTRSEQSIIGSGSVRISKHVGKRKKNSSPAIEELTGDGPAMMQSTFTDVWRPPKRGIPNLAKQPKSARSMAETGFARTQQRVGLSIRILCSAKKEPTRQRPCRGGDSSAACGTE